MAQYRIEYEVRGFLKHQRTPEFFDEPPINFVWVENTKLSAYISYVIRVYKSTNIVVYLVINKPIETYRQEVV